MPPRVGRSMNTISEKSHDNDLNSTGSSDNLHDQDLTTVKHKKRYMVFRELLETEHNYVYILRSILEDYKEQLEILDEQEREEMISKREMLILFAKVEPLLELHQSILAYFERQNQAWNGKNMIGFVFGQEKERLLKCYKSYCNNYDEILIFLKEIKDRPTLHQFFEECQTVSGKRFSLSDMLIRPIQRLPSVILLLKQLQKATPKSNQDYPCIQVALQTVDEVLSKSNTQCKNIDSWQLTLETINTIEGFPSDLVHSNRSYLTQANFKLVHSNGLFKRFKGNSLTFFLFNDLVVVAKCRDKPNTVYRPRNVPLGISKRSLTASVSDLSRTLSRSESFSTLKRSLSFISKATKIDRKSFKFLDILLFTSFRQFLFIQKEGLFYLQLRDEMSDEMCTLKVDGDTTVDKAAKFMTTLCHQINDTSKREVMLLDVSDALMDLCQVIEGQSQERRLSQTMDDSLHPDDLDYIIKHRKC